MKPKDARPKGRRAMRQAPSKGRPPGAAPVATGNGAGNTKPIDNETKEAARKAAEAIASLHHVLANSAAQLREQRAALETMDRANERAHLAGELAAARSNVNVWQARELRAAAEAFAAKDPTIQADQAAPRIAAQAFQAAAAATESTISEEEIRKAAELFASKHPLIRDYFNRSGLRDWLARNPNAVVISRCDWLTLDRNGDQHRCDLTLEHDGSHAYFLNGKAQRGHDWRRGPNALPRPSEAQYAEILCCWAGEPTSPFTPIATVDGGGWRPIRDDDSLLFGTKVRDCLGRRGTPQPPHQSARYVLEANDGRGARVILDRRCVACVPTFLLEGEPDDEALEDDAPQECVGCGCTEADCSGCVAHTGEPCEWVPFCSACAAALPASLRTPLLDLQKELEEILSEWRDGRPPRHTLRPFERLELAARTVGELARRGPPWSCVVTTAPVLREQLAQHALEVDAIRSLLMPRLTYLTAEQRAVIVRLENLATSLNALARSRT
jgi:hypothetical protein